MTHVEYYVANDGTKFDYEEDCIQYEMELKAKTVAGDLFFWDACHNALPLTEGGYEEAVYICVNTEEAAQYLDDLVSSVGMSTPWGWNGEPRPSKWIYLGDKTRHFDWLEFNDLKDFYNTCKTAFNSAP